MRPIFLAAAVTILAVGSSQTVAAQSASTSTLSPSGNAQDRIALSARPAAGGAARPMRLACAPLTGIIYEPNGQPLVGATLLVKGTHDVYVTDAEGKFRLDLYYRIAPIVISVPPLRDRLEDIPQLVEVFLREVSDRHHRPIPEVTDDALNYLCDQRWPGNVRQLRHEMERAFVFTENGRITADDLAMEQGGPEGPCGAAPVRGSGTPRLKELLTPIESEAIRLAMKRHRGNKKRVAEELGVSRREA